MNRQWRIYYLCSVVGVLLLCAYPLYMGWQVLSDMAANGSVLSENYPKYIIPYTPISLGVLVGTISAPLIFRLTGRHSQTVATILALSVFFASELLVENLVIVTETVSTTLESWQMYMCYIPPEGFVTRTWTAVDVLIGEYSPLFKLHFYFISIILILGLLNCFYGFANVIRTGCRERMRILVLQAVSIALFLGLCILACFTAFFRNGDIIVSPLSATLMCLFFIVLGVDAGIFTASFLDRSRRTTIICAAVASLATLAMYLGEMILLSGNLYRFGHGAFFDGLGWLVLAPVDLMIIIASGGITALVTIFSVRTGKQSD